MSPFTEGRLISAAARETACERVLCSEQTGRQTERQVRRGEAASASGGRIHHLLRGHDGATKRPGASGAWTFNSEAHIYFVRDEDIQFFWICFWLRWWKKLNCSNIIAKVLELSPPKSHVNRCKKGLWMSNLLREHQHSNGVRKFRSESSDADVHKI